VLKSIVALVTLDAEKRNILDIVDLCLRRSLHHAAERHPDPAAIKLLVRHTHHPALLAKDTNGDTPLDCAIKYNKSPAVVTIMRTLTIACCLGHFEEMHGAYEEGRTTFATAVVGGAPVELLERMVELGEQDTKKRKITTVCDNEDLFPLQLAGKHRADTAVIKLLARECPERCTVPSSTPSSTTRRAPLSCPCCASATLTWSTATSPPSSTSVASPTAAGVQEVRGEVPGAPRCHVRH